MQPATQAPPTTDLRHLLQRRFERLGWTQVELSERSGVPYQSISRFFAGKKALNSDSLDRLAAAMGGWKKVLGP